MKIMYINTYYAIGSTGSIVRQLGEYMSMCGHDIYYCAGIIRDDNNVHHIYRIGNNVSHFLSKIKNYCFCSESFLVKRDTRNLIKHIETIKPDIIHLHNIHGFFLDHYLLFDYLKSNRIPVVWTFHDCWPITGRCAYFFDVKCSRWMNGCGHCLKKRSYPRTLLFDFSNREWERKKEAFTAIENLSVVTVSKWLENYARKSFLANAGITTIYNGIDTSIFNPQCEKTDFGKYGISGKKIILGVASGWSERKGISDFIELSRRISSNCVIVLVGQYNDQKSLGPNIVMLGPISSKHELSKIYATADVFVNPSRQETFGLTTAEALACGTPVVAYNVTATPEIVPQTYKKLFLAEAYSVDDLYNKLVSVLSLKEKPFGLNDYIENIFSIKKCNESYYSLYQKQVKSDENSN